jgi:hypothetical protein
MQNKKVVGDQTFELTLKLGDARLGHLILCA